MLLFNPKSNLNKLFRCSVVIVNMPRGLRPVSESWVKTQDFLESFSSWEGLVWKILFTCKFHNSSRKKKITGAESSPLEGIFTIILHTASFTPVLLLFISLVTTGVSGYGRIENWILQYAKRQHRLSPRARELCTHFILRGKRGAGLSVWEELQCRTRVCTAPALAATCACQTV